MSSSNGASKQAFANSGTAQGLANTYSNRATSAYNVLTPTLNQMATNPQGYNARQMGNFRTAALQGAGGGNAAATGGALQLAARTNNAGGVDPALTSAGRTSSQELSNAALNVQNQNANLQERQRELGIQGLQNQYATNTGATGNSLGLSDQALNTAIYGDNSALNRWLQKANFGAQLLGSFAGGS